MAPTLLDLHAAALAQLRTGFATVDVHDAEVTKPTLDAAGRIQPYAVLWLAPGTHPEQPLCGPDGSGEHRLHVTVAGQSPQAALWAVDRARAVLDGAWLQLGTDPVHEVGVRWLDGYTPPPVSKDEDAKPTRWFCPLIFTALA